ncbi:MAG: hypothetical protein K5Q68_20240 [Roseococcus sp.]|nr:hypothetical protein [Roseococcus sp.]
MGEGPGLFRVGPRQGWNANPAQRRAFDNTRLPVAARDRFMAQAVSRWVTTDWRSQDDEHQQR